MNILYFLAHPYGFGGAAKQMIMHAHVAQMLDNNVKLVIQDDEEGKHGKQVEEALNAYELSYSNEQYSIATCMETIDILQCIDDIEKIKNIILGYKPDIVHSLQINISVELACRELKIKHVMSIYPILSGMFNIKWDNIYPVNQISDCYYYAKKWKNGLGINSSCVRVIYDCKNKTNLGSNENNNNIIKILNVGVFGEHKQQLVLIKLVERLISEKKHIELYFLGECSNAYGKECKQYVTTNHLDRYVSFCGHVTNIEEYYSSSMLLMHVSKVESYPGVVVEAMANGLPILCTPAGGIGELIENEYNGFCTTGFDIDSIYKTFLKFVEYTYNGKLQEIVENAYKTYFQNHSIEMAKRNIQNIYESLKLSSELVEDKYYTNFLNKMENIYLNLGIHNYSEDIKKNIFFLYHLKQQVQKYNKDKVLIWGAGRYGKNALEWCNYLELNVIGYIDSYKNGKYLGYPIFNSINSVSLEKMLIIVSIFDVSIREQIMGILELKGMKRNVDYILMFNDPCLVPNAMK